MATNPYANKPFLDQQMAAFLNASYSQGNYVSFVPGSVSGNLLTLSASDTSFNNVKPGSYLDISAGAGAALTKAGVLAVNGLVVTLDVSAGTFSTIDIGKIKVINDISGSTVQNIINKFLNSPFDSSAISNYYQVAGAAFQTLNTINAANPTSKASGKNGVRLFIAGDDGTPIFDSGKCAAASTGNATNQVNSLVGSTTPFLGNTWANFKNKITVGSSVPPYDLTNNTNTSNTGVALTVGTAGGNAINENHNSRPEFLGALFSGTGIAYSRRASSTTLSQNLYIAQRMGITPEENMGAVRLNVPVAEA